MKQKQKKRQLRLSVERLGELTNEDMRNIAGARPLATVGATAGCPSATRLVPTI